MNIFLSFIDQIINFLATGGPVLWLILVVTLWMWLLILERLYFVWVIYPKVKDRVTQLWQNLLHVEARGGFEHKSHRERIWILDKVRTRLVSMAGQGLEKHVQFIIALVAICPLLGLFGTVFGMLEVFEVLSYLGGHNVRTTAAGVSKATITTMAGMVAALPGVVVGTYLKRQIQHEREALTDALTIDR